MRSPLTICDMTQFYGTSTGGIKTYLRRKRIFIRDETACRHILVTPGEGDRETHEGSLSHYHVAAPRIPSCPAYRFILRPDKVLAILEREKPDIIELGSLYLLPWVAFRYKRCHGTPVVAFYHTDFPRAYLEKPFKARRLDGLAFTARRLGEAYVRLLSRRCNGFIAASNTVARRLEEMGIRPVALIPLGVDADLFHPSRRSVDTRERLGLKPEDLLLLYAGRLDGEKRISTLLSAFGLIKDVWPGLFVLMGDGPMKEDVIRETAGNAKIRYIPYVSDREEYATMLASADIYVTAGPDETFGLSIAEAQASGLPVVGVAAGALIDRVPEGAGFLGPVDSPKAMAENLLRCSVSKTCRSMGHFTRRLVEADLSWRRTFEKLLSFYNQCGNETSKPL